MSHHSCTLTGFNLEREGLIAQLDGPHIGVGYSVGEPIDDTHPFEVQCAFVRPATGQLVITSRCGVTKVLEDSVIIVHRYVSEYHDAIRERLGIDAEDMGPRGLHKRGYDLHVHLMNRSANIQHTSYMAAMVVSMVSLLIGRRPRDDTAALGEVSYTGLMSPVGEWGAAGVNKCKSQGIRRIVTAGDMEANAEATSMAAVIHADGRPTLEFHRYRYILDALPFLFTA